VNGPLHQAVVLSAPKGGTLRHRDVLRVRLVVPVDHDAMPEHHEHGPAVVPACAKPF